MSNVVSLDDHRPAPTRGGGNRRGTRATFGNVRKLPSGRFQARYTGPDGHEHRAPTTFLTRGDATTWLSLQQAAIIEHRWKPAPPPEKAKRPTFADYSEAWLAGRELKPRTRAEYKRLRTALVDAFGDLRLDEITAAKVRDWHRSMDPTTPTARAHHYALLRTILGTAVDDELIDVNPARIRGAGTSRSTTPIRPATVAELTTITNAIPDRYRLMVQLAAWCALRFGELTELRRRDLDLDANVIRVRRAVTWIKDGEGIAKAIVGAPKSDAGVRDVTIPPHLVAMIETHLNQHAQAGADGLLFPNTDGHHLHHGSLYKVYRPARKAAKREDLRWHDLRHTGATMAAQAGATTRELMDRLGHTTAGVAMRYQHVADGRQAEIARRLSELAGL